MFNHSGSVLPSKPGSHGMGDPSACSPAPIHSIDEPFSYIPLRGMFAHSLAVCITLCVSVVMGLVPLIL